MRHVAMSASPDGHGASLLLPLLLALLMGYLLLARADRGSRAWHGWRTACFVAGILVAGRRALDEYLCATCHRIPGVVGARNTVGPPLGGIAARAYIAGSLKNSHDNMLRWLRDPQKVKPDTGMPNLHLREQDVRDIAAFLSTLRQGD